LARVAEIVRSNLYLIVTALIFIIPLRAIEWWLPRGEIKHLAGDSASIVTAGLILSLTTKGVEAVIEKPHIRFVVEYIHEGLGVLVLLALFLRAWKTLRIGKLLSDLWSTIRSMIS